MKKGLCYFLVILMLFFLSGCAQGEEASIPPEERDQEGDTENPQENDDSKDNEGEDSEEDQADPTEQKDPSDQTENTDNDSEDPSALTETLFESLEGFWNHDSSNYFIHFTKNDVGELMYQEGWWESEGLPAAYWVDTTELGDNVYEFHLHFPAIKGDELFDARDAFDSSVTFTWLQEDEILYFESEDGVFNFEYAGKDLDGASNAYFQQSQELEDTHFNGNALTQKVLEDLEGYWNHESSNYFLQFSRRDGGELMFHEAWWESEGLPAAFWERTTKIEDDTYELHLHYPAVEGDELVEAREAFDASIIVDVDASNGKLYLLGEGEWLVFNYVGTDFDEAFNDYVYWVTSSER